LKPLLQVKNVKLTLSCWELTLLYIDNFGDISRKHSVKDVYILSDSASGIRTVDTDWLTHNNIRRLELSFQHLENLQVKVKLIQIPSHAGIRGNEIADRLAYETSQKLLKLF